MIVYSSESVENAHQLETLANEIGSLQAIEAFHSLRALSERLRRPRGRLSIALLNVGSAEEMALITAQKELLTDLRLILILPDRAKDTISQAHRLHPRFLSYGDGDLQDVRAVLQKMAGSSDAGTD